MLTDLLDRIPVHREAVFRVLEIGSYMGQGACELAARFPKAVVTCVDTFAGPWEAQFDTNTAHLGTRIEKLRGRSGDVLTKLGLDGRRFDVVYVDGDHGAAAVYQDAALAWPLLGMDGFMLFDDYAWGADRPEAERPKAGIDAFLAAAGGCVLHRDWGVLTRKVSLSP